MPRSSVAALVWFVVSLAPARTQEVSPAACALCTEATIECPTCAGAGTVTVACGFCGADGKLQCLVCPPERPGFVDCPNRYCRDGKTRWEGGDSDPCKLCAAKGRIACPSCRGKAAPECIACAGTGKRPRTCWTCAGSRRVACPLCAVDPARVGCGTCTGDGKVACGICRDGAPKGVQPCVVCNGAGDRACTTCRGLDRVACSKCAATGKMRLGSSKYPGVPGPRDKAGVKQCELCEGKAVKNCHDCTKGRVDCPSCEKGQTPSVCRHCLQQRAIGCDECLSGGHARWEVLGDCLVRTGHPARAVPFYERAIERAKAMQGPVVLTQLHLAALDLQAKFDALRGARDALDRATGGEASSAKAGAPMLPPAATLETFWPADVRARYWPDPPQGQELAPWRDAEWMRAHRERLVARLEASLAKARAAAAK